MRTPLLLLGFGLLLYGCSGDETTPMNATVDQQPPDQIIGQDVEPIETSDPVNVAQALAYEDTRQTAAVSQAVNASQQILIFGMSPEQIPLGDVVQSVTRSARCLNLVFGEDASRVQSEIAFLTYTSDELTEAKTVFEQAIAGRQFNNVLGDPCD